MVIYDAIVIGVGGMGSAALYHLARRGLRVLGIEQFGVAHDRGSSHGQTRIIRKAYFEHPSYVPLVTRAYALWAALESATGQRLFRPTGMLLAGPPDGAIISGVLRSAAEHRLDIRTLTAAETDGRFPAFRIPPGHSRLFDAEAGFLRVEECVRAHAYAACSAGARLLTGGAVQSWSARGDEVVVRADGREFRAARLIIAGGAWAGRLLADLNLPLEVRRKVMLWYATTSDAHDLERGCPVFGFETTDGFFYGFPALDQGEIKLALHGGGQAVEDPAGVDRGLHPEDEAPLRRFIAEYLPYVSPRPLRHAVCLYTMTPDEHFVIDTHPRHPNVHFAAGFSGHGFKFAPVVGSVLADLAVQGRTDEPIGFLSARRFARP
ncbi:MAG: FAD-dependent oxidoreductase [Phycisphaerae bacterium]